MPCFRKYAVLFAVFAFMSFSWYSNCFAQSLGGGSGLPELSEETEKPSLLTAYCGCDTLKGIQEGYETKPSTGAEALQCYGAYGVVNSNDTDGDGKEDVFDTLVKVSPTKDTNGDGKIDEDDDPNRNERDLFKLIVKVPATYDGTDHQVLEGDVVIADFTGLGLIASPNSGIKFFKKRTKEGGEWTGFDKTATAEDEVEIWVELSQRSQSLGDKWIKAMHAYTDASGTKKLEFDKIDVTAIEVGFVHARTKTTYFKIFSVDRKHDSIIADIPTSATQGEFKAVGYPEVGEIVAIYDDKNDYVVNAAGATVEREDQSANMAMFRVAKIIGGAIELKKVANTDPFPVWVGKGDYFAVVASKELDNEEVLKNLEHANKWRIGDRRRTQVSTFGIEIALRAYPEKITRIYLADGRKAIFDITRQAKIQRRTVETHTWPTSDEKPNDDRHSFDSDCMSSKHDLLFSYDSPGEGGLVNDEDQAATPLLFFITQFEVVRGNFLEFARVDFVEPGTKNEGGKTGHWGDRKMVGTRCSAKYQWCYALNIVPDTNKRPNWDDPKKDKNWHLAFFFAKNRPIGEKLRKLEAVGGGYVVDNTIVFGKHITDADLKTAGDWDQ